MPEKKRFLALLGSPRPQGNVAAMLKAACESAEAAGYQVERFDLYKLHIAPCTGCMACKAAGGCVVADDIIPLREALIGCDVVALAAPTYFANIPGPVKTVLDRLVGTVMDDNLSPLPKGKLRGEQRYLLLTACNTPAPFHRLAGQATGAFRAMEEVFHISGMKRFKKVCYPGTRKRPSGELPLKLQKKLLGLFA